MINLATHSLHSLVHTLLSHKKQPSFLGDVIIPHFYLFIFDDPSLHLWRREAIDLSRHILLLLITDGRQTLHIAASGSHFHTAAAPLTWSSFLLLSGQVTK